MHKAITATRYMYIFFLTCVVSIAVDILVCNAMIIEVSYFWLVVYTVLVTGVLTLLDFIFRDKKVIILIIIIIVLVTAVYFLFGNELIYSITEFAQSFKSYVYGSYRASEQLTQQIQTALLFGVTLVWYMLIRWFPSRALLGYLSALSLVVLCVIKLVDVSFISRFLLTVFFLIILAETIQFFAYVKRNSSVRIYVISKFIPVTIVLSFIVNILPHSSEPVDFFNLKDKLGEFNTPQAIVDILDFLQINNDFENNTEKIGGDSNNINDSTKLAVVSFDRLPQNTDGRVYFTKKVCDLYENSKWDDTSNLKKDSIDSYALNTLQFMIRSVVTGKTFEDKLKPQLVDSVVSISYINMNKNYIIYPSLAYNFSNNNFDFNSSNPTIKAKGVNDVSYTVQYNYINNYSDYVNTMMKANDDGNNNENIDNVIDYLQGYFNKDQVINSDTLGIEYDNQEYYARSQYTKLPDNISNRVLNLAKSITYKYDSYYDKLKAIEHYLKNNYIYTLTPGNVPNSKELVDYFLFDKKEGYCTYFATSMAVLARSIGIPTRYVSGYVVNTKNLKDNKYTITGKDSHAWVECYFSEAGWIRFEPTAANSIGNTNLNSNPADLSSAEDESSLASDESSVTDGSSGMPDSSSNLPDQSEGDSSAVTAIGGMDSSELDRSIDSVGDEKINLQLTKTNLIFAVVILLAFLLIVIYFRLMFIYTRFNKKYAAMSNSEKVCIDFKIILMILRKKKLIVESNSTLSEIFEKSEFIINRESYNLNKAVKIYMNAFYGECDISDNDVQTVYALRRLFEHDITSHKFFGAELLHRFKFYKHVMIKNNTNKK